MRTRSGISFFSHPDEIVDLSRSCCSLGCTSLHPLGTPLQVAFDTLRPLFNQLLKFLPFSASSPSCTCGSSDLSCGSSRRCSPSSGASGWFFSTQPWPPSVTPSEASSDPLPGLFSPPEQPDNPLQKIQRRSHGKTSRLIV